MNKQSVILVIIVLISSITNAQMATFDAATNAGLRANNTLSSQNLAKNSAILTKAGATLNTLNDMKAQYQEWENNISTVTGYIESGQQIINIGKMVDEVQRTYIRSVDRVGESNYLNATDTKVIIHAYTSLLSDCVNIYSESLDIVTTGTYKMTDAERLALLKSSENQLKRKLKLMRYMDQKIVYSEKQTKKAEFNNSILSKNKELFKN